MCTQLGMMGRPSLLPLQMLGGCRLGMCAVNWSAGIPSRPFQNNPRNPKAVRRGARAQLAEALTGDSSLTALDVGGNNIGPEGITALAGALRGNDALRTLELGYNPIREKGAQALADVVKYDLQVRARGTA